MVPIVTGACLLIGVITAVGFLSRLLNSGKGGGFFQAELFTSLITVVFVGILAIAGALFWVGTHVFLANMIADTIITFGVFFGVAIIAAYIGRAKNVDGVSS